MPTLLGQAPAKINLGLKIVGRRPDGYHELRTVLQTISLADRLAVSYVRRRSTQVTLRCNDQALENEDNLAYRAATEMLAAKHWGGHIKIDLEKRIPHGSGLGGGSSDAAAVLLALEQTLASSATAAAAFRHCGSAWQRRPFLPCRGNSGVRRPGGRGLPFAGRPPPLGFGACVSDPDIDSRRLSAASPAKALFIDSKKWAAYHRWFLLKSLRV